MYSARSFKNRVVTQAMAFVFFLVLPVLITLLVPLSVVQFQRTDAGTTAHIQRFVLIFVPWRAERVDDVTMVRAETTSDRPYRGTYSERRRGVTGTIYGTGQVVIANHVDASVVQAAPELARAIAARFAAFQTAGSGNTLSFNVYASWSLSYILGGIVSALAALYLAGVAAAVLRFAAGRGVWHAAV